MTTLPPAEFVSYHDRQRVDLLTTTTVRRLVDARDQQIQTLREALSHLHDAVADAADMTQRERQALAHARTVLNVIPEEVSA